MKSRNIIWSPANCLVLRNMLKVMNFIIKTKC
jgi:hypothetical protein